MFESTVFASTKQRLRSFSSLFVVPQNPFQSVGHAKLAHVEVSPPCRILGSVSAHFLRLLKNQEMHFLSHFLLCLCGFQFRAREFLISILFIYFSPNTYFTKKRKQPCTEISATYRRIHYQSLLFEPHSLFYFSSLLSPERELSSSKVRVFVCLVCI